MLSIGKQIASAVLAALTVILSGVSAKAVNVQAFPKPPELYSESAVLMDADTGQVLYAKQGHKRMFPASLTKIMTCLLAMQNGRYSDQVTVTQEGSSAPVMGTTHIALTEGEELTLEQLTYAMMVQSANDAANTVALHLSGSFEMFARMMNEEAAKVGVEGTHFVNPSGLPDDNHYTTAYDLALITRAAMQYPEFLKFAGTVKYQLPPTNKNKESRTFNNGNYMFTLGDTYDGAFAGKTGWTEDAGHTLMTIAKRDGVTLICVVMKAQGVVDAQYKDSTALFDYGFDNFHRVVIGEDRFPVQQLEYSDAQGQTQYARIFPARGDMPVLIPTGVEEDDLKIVTVMPQPLKEEFLGRVRVEIRVPEVAGEVMNQVVGSFPVELQPVDLAVEMAAEEDPPLVIPWGIILRLTGITLLALLIVGALFILLLRKSIRLYYRALLRARCRQTHLSAEESYYFATHVFDERELNDLRARYAKEKNLFGINVEDLQVMHKAHKEAQKIRRQRKATAKARLEREEALRKLDADPAPFVWKKEMEEELPRPPVKPISRPVSGARPMRPKEKNNYIGSSPRKK